MLEGARHDLLHQLAYQVAFLGQELTDAAYGLLVPGLTVENAGNASRPTQDVLCLAPRR